MLLKSLEIRKAEAWDTEKGFIGALRTESPAGEIKIRLSDESCRKILEIAAKGIQEAAKELGTLLQQEAAGLTLIEGDKK